MSRTYPITIDIYVLMFGLQRSNFSLATAAGLFKNVVNISLIFLANEIGQKGRRGKTRMKYNMSTKVENIIFNTLNYSFLTLFAVIMILPFLEYDSRILQ